MFRKHSEMKKETYEKCHDGTGNVLAHWVLTSGDSKKGIQFMHDDTIEPNATIGIHPHEKDEEVYFVAEGNGVMILDGKEYPMGPGDVCVCRPGHSHGIRNSSAPMRLIVIGI